MARHNASVTLDQAQALIKAARAKADDIGVPMNVAVVDAGNNLTAFSRMDGLGSGRSTSPRARPTQPVLSTCRPASSPRWRNPGSRYSG